MSIVVQRGEVRTKESPLVTPGLEPQILRPHVPSQKRHLSSRLHNFHSKIRGVSRLPGHRGPPAPCPVGCHPCARRSNSSPMYPVCTRSQRRIVESPSPMFPVCTLHPKCACRTTRSLRQHPSRRSNPQLFSLPPLLAFWRFGGQFRSASRAFECPSDVDCGN